MKSIRSIISLLPLVTSLLLVFSLVNSQFVTQFSVNHSPQQQSAYGRTQPQLQYYNNNQQPATAYQAAAYQPMLMYQYRPASRLPSTASVNPLQSPVTPFGTRRIIVVETIDENPKDSGDEVRIDSTLNDDEEDVYETKNPFSYVIGGLFEPGSENLEDAFSKAIDQQNEARALDKIRLHAKVDQLQKGNSFQAAQKVCRLVRHGVLALYGPQSLETTTYVQSMAAFLEIPHLEARVDFKPPHNHSLNLFPNPYVLVEAYRDLVRQAKWDTFAIVYSSDEGLMRVQEFLKDPEMQEKNILTRRAYGDNDKKILNELKIRGIRNIILDMISDKGNSPLSLFMGAALEEGMTSKYYHYIVTALDLEQADAAPVEATLHSFTLLDKPSSTHALSAALTSDAISHFVQSLAVLNEQQPLEKHKLHCRSTEGWAYGHEIRNSLISTTSNGLTGVIKFDEDGIRSDFRLRLLQNSDQGMKTVGTWSPSEKLIVSNEFTLASPPEQE